MTHIKRVIGTTTTYCTTVDYAEAMNILENRINGDGRFGGKQSLDYTSGFNQHRTAEEALETMRSGWQFGRDKMAAALEGMPTVAAEQPFYAYDVTGEYPDIALFSAGEPEYMVTRYEAIDAATPIVRLYVNRSANCFIKPESLASWGAALLRYAMGLEASGVSTELWVFQCVVEGKDRVWNQILVKDATAPWDIDRVAFALANPDMLRRVIFAIEETHPDLQRDHPGFYSGYGMPSNLNDAQRAELPAGSIVFTKLDDNIGDAEAIKRVDQMVRDQTSEAWLHMAKAAQ